MDASSPVWSPPSGGQTYRALEQDRLEFDVIVVGAGITGATAALLLKQAGKRVALLEARQIGAGVTGASTGHLTQVLDTRYHELIGTFGLEGARLASESSIEAIGIIEHLGTLAGVPDAFTRVPGHLLATNERAAEELQREVEAFRRLNIRFAEVESLPPFGGRSAIRVEHQGALDPRRYAHAVASLVHGDGSSVFEGTPVRSIEQGDRCTVVTSKDASIVADQVILATHSPLTATFVQTKVAPYRSYVVAGPLERALPGLVWDLEDPYHYVRTAVIRGTPYWVVGGADHKTGHEEDTTGPLAQITEYAAGLGLTEVTHRWSAQVLEPVDGLPYIGTSRTEPRVHVATGFSGNGLTFGTVAARILADACSGKPNRFAELYDARRLPKAEALPAYVGENVDFPLELVKGAVGAIPVVRLEDVAPGDGAIVRAGGRRLAAYRDPQGAVHALSPICTHLKCVVVFNRAEKSWDCPCHGSRFDIDGAVLDGPAVTPLERVAVDA